MRLLPVDDPGEPETGSATRYLFWLARKQWTSMALGVLWGVTWMLSQALMPAAIGKTIDQGITAKDTGALLRWSGVVLVLGLTTAASGILRHRCAVTNWLSAAYRTVQLTARQATRLGATLPKKVAAGDVVAVGTSDIAHIGSSMDVTARTAGALVSIVVVAAILLAENVQIGLTVLLGVPVIMAFLGPLLKPMHRRQSQVRELPGQLTGRANDIVAGLRVLRGIGGEPGVAERYKTESQKLRFAGVHVARVESILESAQVLLPGMFVVGVTWLAARLAVSGRITPGELVAYYGYAAFLLLPLRTLTEASSRFLRAHVAAKRVIRVLSLEHNSSPSRRGLSPLIQSGPPTRCRVNWPTSRAVWCCPPGSFTAVAAADPREAIELADRLGRYAPDDGVTFDGIPLAAYPLAEVRRRILVADNDARLFAGRLADELALSYRTADAAASPESVLPSPSRPPYTRRPRTTSSRRFRTAWKRRSPSAAVRSPAVSGGRTGWPEP